MSRIDVIVPCYNYGRFLSQCVDTVLTQTGVDVRVLIIDDESSDNTAEVAVALMRRDSRVAAVRHCMNKGHITTYNEGLEWASADYTLLLSADDYLVPGALERSTILMDGHPEVGFTFGNALELNDSGHSAPNKAPLEATRIMAGHEFIQLSGAENLVPTCTAVVRTELQKRLGGIPQRTAARWRYGNVAAVRRPWFGRLHRRNPRGLQTAWDQYVDSILRDFSWQPDVHERRLLS